MLGIWLNSLDRPLFFAVPLKGKANTGQLLDSPTTKHSPRSAEGVIFQGSRIDARISNLTASLSRVGSQLCF